MITHYEGQHAVQKPILLPAETPAGLPLSFELPGPLWLQYPQDNSLQDLKWPVEPPGTPRNQDRWQAWIELVELADGRDWTSLRCTYDTFTTRPHVVLLCALTRSPYSAVHGKLGTIFKAMVRQQPIGNISPKSPPHKICWSVHLCPMHKGQLNEATYPAFCIELQYELETPPSVFVPQYR